MAIILPYKGVMPRVHPSAFIARNAVIIGDVEIAANANIWYGCVLRGDVNSIRVGENSNIQDGTIIHTVRPNMNSKVGASGGITTIGKNVTIGHMALLHACIIEDNCFVGMSSTITDFAVVTAGSWLAANGFLPPRKTTIAGEVWAGSPAKKLRDMSDEEKKFIQISADNYVRLAEEHKDL